MMSALPVRGATPQQPFLLKLHNTPYALDPYRDRIESEGVRVLNTDGYDEALQLAHLHRPALIVVNDDPDQRIDAVRWITLQHTDRMAWMAVTPLIILAGAERASVLRLEQMPDRVLLLQRRPDTLNRLTQAIRYLLRAYGWL
jgi:hypothetical protein